MMNNTTSFADGRALDIICLGRLGADFYAQQIGARLEDVASFAKYLGGSSANTAFGCARLGLKAALISRVGNDAMGRFLVETLVKEGCDVSHVGVDPRRLTAAVVLGIKDRDTFPLIFMREDCADMAIPDADVDEAFIGSSRALLITGTHFSQPHVHRISTLALERARARNVRTVLDIDYRPVLWGLTARGDGETRFIASDTVTSHLQGILPLFDLVIGTEDEFAIAGGSTDVITSLEAVRRVTAATLVVKRGPMGCAVIEGAIPSTLDAAFNGRGVTVEVLNVLGAGDAFSAGFLSGWVMGEDYTACTRYANACGALVVSRHGCAPAMPTRIELDYYIANAASIPRPDRDAALTRLHRVTAPRPSGPRSAIFALDFSDRDALRTLAEAEAAPEAAIPALKKLLVRAVAEMADSTTARGVSTEALRRQLGMLCDDHYGQDALNAATGRGGWVARPVELEGSNPLVFEHGRSIGTTLVAWPVEQIVSCTVAFHPDDDAENRLENEAQVRALYDAVQASGHELLLDIAPPSSLPQGADVVLRALKRLYNLGIYPEWWRVPMQDAAAWGAIDALIDDRDPYCRGVLVSCGSATGPDIARVFADAQRSRRCAGFIAGRAVYEGPAREWLSAHRPAADASDVSGSPYRDHAFIAAIRERHQKLIDRWIQAAAETTAAAIAAGEVATADQRSIATTAVRDGATR